MKRGFSGNLKHLAPPSLLRVLSAAAFTGVLEISTGEGELRLEVVEGRAPVASDEELERAGRVLRSNDGTFLFEPCELKAEQAITLPLTAYAETALSWAGHKRASYSSEVDLEQLAAGDLIDFSRPTSARANIHVLPKAPLDNPLDNLLSDLERTAPEELLFAQVGVVSVDPRLWRGTLEADWRRRGWNLRSYPGPSQVALEELDVLVVHQRLPSARVGQEEDWIGLVQSASQMMPRVPVVWVGPLGDSSRVNRLIGAGVAFLMPSPQGESGGTLQRFLTALTTVVDRQLAHRGAFEEPELQHAVSGLVDALLHETDSDQALSPLLQLAAGSLTRGAVLEVEDTAIRCRAGYGYPLARGGSALPRGVGFLERVIRSREPVIGIDPEAAGARQLARVLGVEQLPFDTAVVPLGVGSSVLGLLIADRDGDPLPELGEFVILVQRLGGALLR